MTSPGGPSGDQWGSDVPVSMPVPIDADPGAKVDLGGLAFITTGLVHDLTEVDREELLGRGYGPPGGHGG